MNLPTLNLGRNRDTPPRTTLTGSGLDEHMAASQAAQRQADKWLISGSILIGTAALGIFGLPLFLRGVWLLRKAARDGLSVRPMLVTLLGYLVIIDAAINTVGWALDLVANHTILARILLNGWGAMFDAGYFWHYNELWLGGAAGPGEKAMEVGMILTVFTMRIAAAIGFLQMKRWGHQWMIITCWMGVLIWCLYVFNMTMYADVRFAGRHLPGRRLVALRHLLHHARSSRSRTCTRSTARSSPTDVNDCTH